MMERRSDETEGDSIYSYQEGESGFPAEGEGTDTGLYGERTDDADPDDVYDEVCGMESHHQELAAATHSGAPEFYDDEAGSYCNIGENGENEASEGDSYHGESASPNDTGGYYGDEDPAAPAVNQGVDGDYDASGGEVYEVAYHVDEDQNGELLLESAIDDYGNASIEELQIEEAENFFQAPTDQVVETARTAPVGTAPNTGTVAQVILITTSLGSVRRQFFGSRRAQKALDCKGVPYFLVDANREVARGAELMDSTLLDFWIAENLLLLDSTDATKLSLPQVLLDGVAIGDEVALQDLEEDGDLDWILARAACPACLNERQADDLSCKFCGVTFYPELIAEELESSGRVQKFLRGYKCVGDTAVTATQRMNYAEIVKLAEQEVKGGAHAALETYEELFGEPPPNDEY